MKTALMNSKNVTGQRTLLLATCNGIEFIDVSTIIRVEAVSNYSKIFFSNRKTLVVAKVLRWFEERLSALSVERRGIESEVFIRIHRTHLVNKSFIRHYRAGKITLLNGEYVDVSKRKRTYFLKCLYEAA